MDKNKKETIVVFDLETNGFRSDDAVLSFSAIVLDTNSNKVIGIYDRFYFLPDGHEYNDSAIKVNGLDSDTVLKKRKAENATYAETFQDDRDIYRIFEGATRVVAHNVSFDTKFLLKQKNIGFSKEKLYCTMLETQYKYNAPIIKKSKPKLPRLFEAVEYFKIDTDDIEGDYHDGIFDCMCTLKVYQKLMEEDTKSNDQKVHDDREAL